MLFSVLDKEIKCFQNDLIYIWKFILNDKLKLPYYTQYLRQTNFAILKKRYLATLNFRDFREFV